MHHLRSAIDFQALQLGVSEAARPFSRTQAIASAQCVYVCVCETWFVSAFRLRLSLYGDPGWKRASAHIGLKNIYF